MRSVQMKVTIHETPQKSSRERLGLKTRDCTLVLQIEIRVTELYRPLAAVLFF